MKILVSGSSGYVGSTLVPLLLNSSYTVIGLDRNNPSLDHPLFNYVNIDLDSEYNNVRTIIEECDIIIHLAAVVGFPACNANPNIAWRMNLAGTDFINDCRNKDQRIIFASTDSVYGPQNIKNVDEFTVPNPQSIYGKSKSIAEDNLYRKGNAVILRFSTGFGLSKKMRHDTIPNQFSREAVTLGKISVFQPEVMRSFIHVKDMARAILFSIENNLSGIYNVGNSSLNVPKKTIAEIVNNVTKCQLETIEGSDVEGRDAIVSYEKIQLVGYKTTISLKEGIQELVDYYRLTEVPTSPV